MRLVVTGSRGFDNYYLLTQTLDRLTEDEDRSGLIILHGGAKGADMLAARYCFENHIAQEVYHAEWGKYGNKAGPIRNTEMLEAAGKDALVVGFWNGESPGTRDCLTKAKTRGMKVHVVTFGRKEGGA